MHIRKAEEKDAPGIHAAHTASIRELCSGVYGPSRIHAWTAALSPEAYVRGMDVLDFYVAEAGERISGLLIVDTAGGEICALYIAPWSVGLGLGRLLLGLGEAEIRRRGHRRMHLKSTLNAKSFYVRMGFECGEICDHPLESGEILPCVRMEKRLDPLRDQAGS